MLVRGDPHWAESELRRQAWGMTAPLALVAALTLTLVPAAAESPRPYTYTCDRFVPHPHGTAAEGHCEAPFEAASLGMIRGRFVLKARDWGGGSVVCEGAGPDAASGFAELPERVVGEPCRRGA
ncbi:hypothetical protein GCM10010357_47530 [Streptomyces luteireticuli]|uniref:Secreted protein n=2 Tax=Streptomyces luteireticuli TaxID=173858 RepID=A0ABN0YZ19_9ACTN